MQLSFLVTWAEGQQSKKKTQTNQKKKGIFD